MDDSATVASRHLERMFADAADKIHAYAVSQVGWTAAPDVVADTFLVAWRRIDDVPDEPLAWLLGTARKVIASHRRGEERRNNLVMRLRDTSPLERTSVPASSDDAHDDVRDALYRLSELDREVLVLSAWFDLTAGEAAQIQGCSSATFTVRLHRARKRMRRLLTQQDGTELSHIPASDWRS